MRTRLFILLLALLPATVGFAQSDSDYEGPSNSKSKSTNKQNSKSDNKIYSGFSGGMLLHMGYGLPAKASSLYGNASQSLVDTKDGGIMIGIGGQIRVHLFDHMRVGAEGYFSSMPKSGNRSVRTGWGGAMIDGYTTWKIVRPFVGMGIGGGSISRTYVNEDVRATNSADLSDDMLYNASFSKTPFFYLDPTIGMEIMVSDNFGIVIRIDYMLPFGRDKLIANGEGGATLDNGSKLLCPNGPRFYIGFTFDHSKKSKK